LILLHEQAVAVAVVLLRTHRVLLLVVAVPVLQTELLHRDHLILVAEAAVQVVEVRQLQGKVVLAL
jgi:hypothetical protein